MLGPDANALEIQPTRESGLGHFRHRHLTARESMHEVHRRATGGRTLNSDAGHSPYDQHRALLPEFEGATFFRKLVLLIVTATGAVAGDLVRHTLSHVRRHACGVA